MHLTGMDDETRGNEMVKVVMTEATEPAQVQASRSPFDPNQTFGQGLGSIVTVRKEVDDAFEDIKMFHNVEPDQVLRYCSGHSARMSELRVLIQRIEVIHKQWKPVRVNEVEVCLAELQEQFKIASRLISVRELDFRMTMGAP